MQFARSRGLRFSMLAVAVAIAGCSQETPEQAERSSEPDSFKSIDEALERVERIGEPEFDPALKHTPGYMDRYRSEQHKLYQQKAAILLAACERFGDDSRIPNLMDRRWQLLCWNQSVDDIAEEVLADINARLAENHGPLVEQHGLYWRAKIHASVSDCDPVACVKEIREFVDRFQNDPRCASLLQLIAENTNVEASERMGAYRKILMLSPDSYLAKFIPGRIRQIQEIGQPFDLEFSDVVSGRVVSTEVLRGKILLIDFWSTQCGPCLEQMPHLVQLKAKLGGRGLEILGVSLDEPNQEQAVLECIGRLSMNWPNYYQGHGYDSEFSKDWGIGAIPSVFLIDRLGVLRATNVHDGLEEKVLELLAE